MLAYNISIQVAKLEKLTKDNYASWKYKVMLFVKVEELWHLVISYKASDMLKEQDREGNKKQYSIIEDVKDWNKKDA